MTRPHATQCLDPSIGGGAAEPFFGRVDDAALCSPRVMMGASFDLERTLSALVRVGQLMDDLRTSDRMFHVMLFFHVLLHTSFNFFGACFQLSSCIGNVS